MILKIYKTSANNEYSFCGESEDNDPNPEFEEYLSCAVCGDNGKLRFMEKEALVFQCLARVAS
jgi:ethanolamine ammonia-lyase large subunit